MRKAYIIGTGLTASALSAAHAVAAREGVELVVAEEMPGELREPDFDFKELMLEFHREMPAAMPILEKRKRDYPKIPPRKLRK